MSYSFLNLETIICSVQSSNYGFLTYIQVSFFFLISEKTFFFLTLQYCIGFAIYQHESATGIHVFPILNPPPSSLPVPSLWVIPVHQPQASSIVHRTFCFLTAVSTLGESCELGLHLPKNQVGEFNGTSHSSLPALKRSILPVSCTNAISSL